MSNLNHLQQLRGRTAPTRPANAPVPKRVPERNPTPSPAPKLANPVQDIGLDVLKVIIVARLEGLYTESAALENQLAIIENKIAHPLMSAPVKTASHVPVYQKPASEPTSHYFPEDEVYEDELEPVDHYQPVSDPATNPEDLVNELMNMDPDLLKQVFSMFNGQGKN